MLTTCSMISFCLYFCFIFFFFFNDTATTEIYTLSLHDALPIWGRSRALCRGWNRLRDANRLDGVQPLRGRTGGVSDARDNPRDRKSTRLNSSHSSISYAVFCLKKKKKKKRTTRQNIKHHTTQHS